MCLCQMLRYIEIGYKQLKDADMDCLCNGISDKAPMRLLKPQKVFANTVRPQTE